MSRFKRLLANFSPSNFKDLRSDLYIDFGSARTKVIHNHKLVFNQFTALIVHSESQSILCIGDQVLRLMNKTPPGAEVVFPLKDGVIADDKLAKAYLSSMLNQIFPQKKLLQNIKGAISIASTCSPVERQVQQKVLKDLGLGSLKIKTHADAIFAKLQKNLKVNNLCILDMGLEKSELSLFSYGEKLLVRSLAIGGLAFTQKIKDIIRNKYKTEISFLVAEEIKLKVARLLTGKIIDKNFKKRAIRGKDVLNNTIKTITVSSEDFLPDFIAIANELIEEINIFFAKIPAGFLTSVLENGIYVTGGASALTGLSDYLSKNLKCEMLKSKSPELDVVKGLGIREESGN